MTFVLLYKLQLVMASIWTKQRYVIGRLFDVLYLKTINWIHYHKVITMHLLINMYITITIHVLYMNK